MKSKKLNEASSNAIYKRILKKLRDDYDTIICSRCPYHKNENNYKRSRTWKRHRKFQYKVN